jgi:hypothetical protein
VGAIWPNGEFGVSRQKEMSIPALSKSHHETDETQFNRLGIIAHGIQSVIEFRQNERGRCLLGSSLLTKPRKAQKRGSKGISRYGSKTVRNAGYLLEREYHRKRLTFATLTLPNVSKVDADRVIAAWSKIVKRFTEEVKRELQRHHLPAEIVSVTEVQEKRLKRSGICALHLHLLFKGTHSFRGGWAIAPTVLRDMWRSAVSPHLSEECDWSSCENMQRVKKSAAGYLGKYMSKGVGVLKALKESGGSTSVPSAWWNCTFSLRRKVKSEIIRKSEPIQILAAICQSELRESLDFCREVLIKLTEDFTYPVGWYGRICLQLRTELGLD